jgi:hypothetical protein
MTRLLHALQFRWQRWMDVYDPELLPLDSLLTNTVVHVAWLLTSEIDYQAERLIKWIARRCHN